MRFKDKWTEINVGEGWILYGYCMVLIDIILYTQFVFLVFVSVSKH